jgi:hypothetical protein
VPSTTIMVYKNGMFSTWGLVHYENKHCRCIILLYKSDVQSVHCCTPYPKFRGLMLALGPEREWPSGLPQGWWRVEVLQLWGGLVIKPNRLTASLYGVKNTLLLNKKITSTLLWMLEAASQSELDVVCSWIKWYHVEVEWKFPRGPNVACLYTNY